MITLSISHLVSSRLVSSTTSGRIASMTAFSRTYGDIPSTLVLRWNTFKISSTTHTLSTLPFSRGEAFSDYRSGWLEAPGDLTRYRIVIAAMAPPSPSLTAAVRSGLGSSPDLPMSDFLSDDE